MKKISEFISKHILAIQVLMLLVVIGLYIIEFSSYISEKAEKILTAFAAVSSTFLLFLAFLENRRSNELKTQEHFYFEVEKEVTEIEERIDHLVFSDTDYILQLDYPISIQKFNQIKYYKFIYGFKEIFEILEKDSDYNYCKEIILNNTSVKIDSETSKRLQSINVLMTYLQRNIGNILTLYLEVVAMFNRIDKFNIEINLKKLLTARLNAILTEFDLINEGPNEYAEVANYLFEFKLFAIKNSSLTTKNASVLSNLRVFYSIMKPIREKYKDSSLQMDPYKAYKPFL